MKAEKKIDLFRELSAEYKQFKEPAQVEPTPGQFLAIGGKGAPGSDDFQKAVAALYSMAFTIKMSRKAAGLGDYVICKLEALWWVEEIDDLSQVDQSLWHWKVMIRTPEIVTDLDLNTAREVLLEKGKGSGVEQVVLEEIHEGTCVQMLHVGPYEREPETIGLIKEYMFEKGMEPAGPHHEIYISDPRRVEPAKLKTILRQPVRKV